VRNAGMQTLSSLRLEKAYRDFGVDIDNTDNPIEAGLGFAVKLDLPGGFIGRKPLAELKAAGTPKRRMLQFLLRDPGPLMHGNELIYLNGKEVGYVHAGAFGHTLGGAVGLGFAEHDVPLTPAVIAEGTWEIGIAGERFPATASLKPMYDPRLERVRDEPPAGPWGGQAVRAEVPGAVVQEPTGVAPAPEPDLQLDRVAMRKGRGKRKRRLLMRHA